MTINGSPDISVLSIKAIFDISGTTPIIYLENQSQGDNLAGVSYAFLVKSPTQTFIHSGDINSPDVVGVWVDHTLADAWPRPFNNIEWSGAPYTFQAIIKDSNGDIFYGQVQNAAICHPNGNTQASKNTFGVASVLVQVKCEQGRIYFQDQTNASYKGLTGTIGSSTLRVNFPMDETGVVPDAFVASSFSSAMVPITYSGKGYQFLATSIYQYEISEDTFVRIKYVKSDTFGVWCNIDLLPLLCEYEKLINSIENGSCSNSEDANQKLMLINPKLSIVLMGIMQPLLGIDVPAVIDEIKLIGGFDCDCCGAPTGIIPTNSSIIDGYVFSVVSTGGDVGGLFVPNGNNIQLQLHDKSYVFKICDGSPQQTTAFTVNQSISGDGFTKTYCLQVDVDQLAEDLLTAISTNAALVNLLNSIVSGGGDGSFNLVVDGDCIFDSSNSCDYTFTLSSIPINTTFALLSSISTQNQLYTLNYSFNLTNLPSLQAALNALGIGTFIVTNPSGQTVVISSTNNTNNILQVLYKNPSITVASMTKECTGYVPLSANQVIQKIIDYLCGIDGSKVKTSQSYVICYIDPSDNTKKEVTVESGTALSALISELIDRGCQTIDYVMSLGAVNCAAMTAQFPARVEAMQANDYFLNTRGGLCSRIDPVEAFYTMLIYGATNPDVLTAFCTLVSACAGGNPCAAYTSFSAAVDAGSPAGNDIDLIVTFSHPAAISNTIRYARIDNTATPTYVTIPGILPGESPYTIPVSPLLQNGQYRVYIRPIYADGRVCPETVFDTPACTGINSFSAIYNGTNIVINYTADPSLPSVKVNISYPNGGSFSAIYTNDGNPISIAPPSGVYGNFFSTIQPVCNEDTGFFGETSAQASFVISEDQTVLIEVIDPSGGSQNRITNVTGINGFIFGSIVNEGETQVGSHATFIGPISVTVIQPSVGGVTNGVALYVNGLLVECIEVTGASLFGQTVSFGSRTYNSTDVIRITYDAGICDESPTALGEFNVINTVGSGQIISVNPSAIYDILTGMFPINPAEEVEAQHGDFTAALAVQVTASGTFELELRVNDIVIEEIGVTGDGTYTFASITVDASDKVEIEYRDII